LIINYIKHVLKIFLRAINHILTIFSSNCSVRGIRKFLKGPEFILTKIGEKWAIILRKLCFWETATLLENT
jgi:hypothetical protein